jgi:excisionase family DNA binding protein
VAALDLATTQEVDALRRELAELRALVEGRAIGDALSTEQAAALAGVTPKTVRAWVEAHRLRAARRGRRLVIRRADLDAYLAGSTQKTAGVLATLTPRVR